MLVVTGSALADPGGWQAIGLTAAWLLPLGMVGAGGDWLRELSINVVGAPLVATGLLYVVAAARRSRTPGTQNHPTSALV